MKERTFRVTFDVVVPAGENVLTRWKMNPLDGLSGNDEWENAINGEYNGVRCPVINTHAEELK